jgi:hypothetical protein
MNYATSVPWYLDILTPTKLFVKNVEIFKKYFFKEENFVSKNKKSSSRIFFFTTWSLQI